MRHEEILGQDGATFLSLESEKTKNKKKEFLEEASGRSNRETGRQRQTQRVKDILKMHNTFIL